MSALFSFLQAWPAAPEVMGRVARTLDLKALVAESIRDRIAPLVRQVLSDAKVELPAPQQEELRRNALAIMGMDLRVKALLFRTLRLFAREGIRCVPLKGYALAFRLYPDPVLRGTSDVDVLVSPRDFDRARAALATIGLQEPPAKYLRRALREYHHLSLGSDAGMVELHFQALRDFGTALAADPLLSASRPFEMEGLEVLGLRPEDELVHLSGHASHHYLERLTSLLDLKLLLLKHPGLSWEQVVGTARSNRLSGPVYAALLAARTLGAEIPPEVTNALRPMGPRAVLVRQLAEPSVFPKPFSQRKWLSYAAGTALADTFGGRAAFALNLAKGWIRARVD